VTSPSPPVEPHAYRAFEHAGWQGAAARYPGSFAHATAPYAPVLLDAVGAATGTRLLDIACGPGIVAAAAAQRGCAVVGVDFSAAMVAAARRQLPAATFHEADAEALPLPDASVDAAVSNFGLHHFPDPARALREVLRVLRPGGRLAATVWAPPEQNVGWRLMFEAIAAHGTPAPALPTPPRGALNRAADCARLLVEAGAAAEAVTTRIVTATWRLRAPDDLIEGFAAGTVRMAALLSAQPPAARARIRETVAQAVGAFGRDGAWLVPTAAVLVSATAA
jgi:SAM-dependent methyltransferase